MTLDIQSMEALAHYTRGGVTVFFVFWCFLLRKYEKRSNMLKLLYVSSLLIAVCYAKDVLFAFPSVSTAPTSSRRRPVCCVMSPIYTTSPWLSILAVPER